MRGHRDAEQLEVAISKVAVTNISISSSQHDDPEEQHIPVFHLSQQTPINSVNIVETEKKVTECKEKPNA